MTSGRLQMGTWRGRSSVSSLRSWAPQLTLSSGYLSSSPLRYFLLLFLSHYYCWSRSHLNYLHILKCYLHCDTSYSSFLPNQVSYFEIYLDKIRDLLDGEWCLTPMDWVGGVVVRRARKRKVTLLLGFGTVCQDAEGTQGTHIHTCVP